MAQELTDVLVEALEQKCSVKDYLASCLTGEDKQVLDEGLLKRKRGRPRKSDEALLLRDLPEERYARAAMLADKKNKARMQDRLNPGATEAEQKRINLNADLRDIGWDLADSSGTDDDLQSMLEELDELGKEGMLPKELEEFRPYVDWIDKVSKFRGFKDEVSTRYGEAREYLAKGDVRRVEGLLAYLKPRIRELNGKYEEIASEFDNVCEAICSREESKRILEGRTQTASLEVEKHGIGMMSGENYSTYSKRMKGLGISKEIPKSIKDLEARVESTERRWRSVAGISQADFSQIKENWAKTVQKVLSKSMLASNLKISAVNRVLEEGLDFGDYDIGHGILQPLNPSRNLHMGRLYGEIIVQWKNYKTVATLLFADSLTLGMNGYNYICPSFITNPSPCSFNPENRNMVDRLKHEVLDVSLPQLCELLEMPYCELQLHGKEETYDAEAVESIWFSSEFEICNLSMGALKAISEYEIPLYVDGEQVAIESGKIERVADKKGN